MLALLFFPLCFALHTIPGNIPSVLASVKLQPVQDVSCDSFNDGIFASCDGRDEAIDNCQLDVEELCDGSRDCVADTVCGMLGNYATECGVLQWRDNIIACRPVCPPGQVFSAAPGEVYCNQFEMDLGPFPAGFLGPRCVCPEGELFNDNNDCVTVDGC